MVMLSVFAILVVATLIYPATNKRWVLFVQVTLFVATLAVGLLLVDTYIWQLGSIVILVANSSLIIGWILTSVYIFFGKLPAFQ